MVKGKVHSFQSLGTLDGPGLRCVVFMQGCNLRCAYCHNPDTWNMDGGTIFSPEKLFEKIKKFKNYFGKEGGVTVSGGEALLQSDFVKELFVRCKIEGISTCLDTSGSIINDSVKELLRYTDICLLDIKMTNEEDYKKYTKGSFLKTMEFLKLLQERNIRTIIRQVTVKGITDGEENIKKLLEIKKNFSCVEKIEFLPFRKLCSEKYKKLGIPFPMEDIPETTEEKILELNKKLTED